MAVNTQTIRVDLNTGKEIPVAFAHQKDTNRQLTFTLYNKGQPYSPSGMTAKFAYRSPTVNGEYSVITGSEMPSGTILANTVTVTLTEKMTSVAGMGLLTMILSSSGNTLRPVNIKLLVQGSADGDDQVLFASDWPDGLYDYMDNWLEENEPTEIANLKSDISSFSNYKDKVVFAEDVTDFTSDTVYSVDGTTKTVGGFKSVVANCDDCYQIRYTLTSFRNSSNNLNIISFLDENGNYISGLPARSYANTVVSGDVRVPNGAVTVVGLWLTTKTEIPSVVGFKKESVPQTIYNMDILDGLLRDGNKDLIESVDDFSSDIIYNSDGEQIFENGSNFRTTLMIPCDRFSSFEYTLNSSRNSSRTHNIVSFFDSDYNYISGVPSTTLNTTLTVTGKSLVPFNAKYLVATWDISSADTPLLVAYDSYAKANVPKVVNAEMSVSQFATAFNSYLSTYAEFNRCSINAFDEIPNWEGAGTTWETVIDLLNKNLRKTVATEDMTIAQICENVNYALTQRIWYYTDAIANAADRNRNWSVKISNPQDNVLGEPSVCVSEDGGTMWLYTHLHRLSTKDGLTWSTPEPLVYNYATRYIRHSGMCIIKGMFYQIGESQAGDLLLYKSTDGLNFDFVGKLFGRGDELVTGKTVAAWGNPYMIWDAGTGRYYLYIEVMNNGEVGEYTPWEICLASCNSLEYDRGTDGNGVKLTGNWDIYADNPVIAGPYKPIRQIKYVGHDTGNVDFCKLSDNNPLKVNGKYYILVHSSLKTDTGFIGKIARMSSKDLTVWEFDGTIFDNRVVPEAGENISTNTDHCIIEFKGKTYLFYTVNINSNLDQYIAYEIDTRPLRQIVLEYP